MSRLPTSIGQGVHGAHGLTDEPARVGPDGGPAVGAAAWRKGPPSAPPRGAKPR